MGRQYAPSRFVFPLALLAVSAACSGGTIISGSTYEAYDAAFDNTDAIDAVGKIT